MTSPHKASSSYPPIYGDGSPSSALDGGGEEEEQDEFGSGAAANGGKGRYTDNIHQKTDLEI